MIEVKNLTKRYGSNVAIDHVSFSVDEGTIVGFLGPNGAGKSTTMNIITGYLSASERFRDGGRLRHPRRAERGQETHRLPAGACRRFTWT